MKFEQIYSLVGHVPFISKRNADFLYHLIIKEKLTNILELGIAHGTATCYMAAALDELGGGSITAVDLLETKDVFKPSAEEQLKNSGLSPYAQVVRMQTGYTWFLHNDIAKNTVSDKCNEIYDLCIIDGPKNWTIDGAAFFMVDKLLKKNGWIIFDDYKWTYATRGKQRDSTDGITHRSLSREEREIPHIKEIFELLVKQHQNYGKLIVSDNRDWAIAQKTQNQEKVYSIRYTVKFRNIISRLMRNIYRKLNQFN
jgi:predicted O-methyltransferase YrrM